MSYKYKNPSVTFKLNGFNTSVLLSWLQHISHDFNGNLIAEQTSFHSKTSSQCSGKKKLYQTCKQICGSLILCTVKN